LGGIECCRQRKSFDTKIQQRRGTAAYKLPIRASNVSLENSNHNTIHKSFMQREGVTAVVPLIPSTVWPYQ
jgi:hypothetical protein